MKLIFLRTLATVSALLVTSTAHAQSANLIDKTYGGFSSSWTNRPGGMLVRYRPFIVEGKLVICGGYSSQGGSRQNRLALAILKESSVKLNGSTAMRDMSFFAPVNSSQNSARLEGSSANCRATSVDANNEMLSTFEFDSGDGRVTIRR